MQTITTKHLFRVLGVLTMAAVFLQGLFVLYLPFPYRVTHFYFLLWIPLIILYDYKLLLNKSLLMVLLFVAIMYLGLDVFWGDIVFKGAKVTLFAVLLEILPVYGAVLMILYFIKSGDQKGLKLLIYASFVFIIITTILTIRGLIIEPMAVRFIMAGRRDEIDVAVQSLGLGGYGFFNSVMLLIPVFGYFLKKPGTGIAKKAFVLFFVAFAIYPMFLAGITTTVLFAVVFFIYSAYFIGRYSTRPITPIIIIGLFLFVFNNFTSDILVFVSDRLGEGWIKHRLDELAITVELRDYDPEEGITYFSRTRLSLTMQSLWGFLANPLTGTGDSGGHAYWFDRLAMFGLLGWLPIILIFFQHAKLMQNTLRKEHYPYYFISVVAIFLFGIIKGNVVSAQTMVVVFFLAPGMFLLEKLTAKQNNNVSTIQEKQA